MSAWQWLIVVTIAILMLLSVGVWVELKRRSRNSLGRGRLGNIKDAGAAGLLKTEGPYLGTLTGRALHYNGDGHLLTYGRTGAGKGQTVIMPNLAMLAGRSLVVTDPKGENARASAHHRKHGLGSKIVFVNPWRVDGLPSVKVNPLARLSVLAAAGRLDIEAMDVAKTIVPMPALGVGENEWVYAGAQRMLALRLRYMAHVRPAENTLGALWEFINQPFKDFKAECVKMESSGVAGVVGAASKLADYGEDNPKSFEAITSRAADQVELYTRGGVLADSSSSDEFDFSALKKTPHTVFVIVPADKMAAAGPWLALITQHILETVAHAPGDVRTLFLLDEFANLPRMPVFEKALRLYRGYGLQFWPFVQGRHSLRAVYGDALAKDIEDQADVLQMFGVEDAELLKDVEAWSGGYEVRVKGTTSTVGADQSGKLSQSVGGSEGRQRRAVLHSEDIRTLGASEQILRVAGKPLFVAGRQGWWDMAGCRGVLHDARKPIPADQLADLQS